MEAKCNSRVDVGVSKKSTNQPFDGCPVSDWDLSVKIRRRMGSSFMISVPAFH